MQNLHQFSGAADPEQPDPEQPIDAIGGDRLDGSGFETEDPEVAFSEAED